MKRLPLNLKREKKKKTERNRTMKMNDWIRAIAGTFVLASLLLAHYHHPNWLWFTAFVGANLIQSAFTKWCLMEKILAKIGVRPA